MGDFLYWYFNMETCQQIRLHAVKVHDSKPYTNCDFKAASAEEAASRPQIAGWKHFEHDIW